MSLDERSTVIFYNLIYLENFVLITRGFYPLDPQMTKSNARVSKLSILICLILYGFVIIILNQVNEVKHVFRV